MADEEGPAWLPGRGALLTRSDLAGIFVALRAIIAGTEPDDAARRHDHYLYGKL